MSNGSDMFQQIGMCKALGGKKKAPIYAGIAGAGVVEAGAVLLAWTASKSPVDPTQPVPIDPKAILISSLPIALGLGGLAALLTYFTCSGVEAGIPYSRARKH